MSNKIEIYKRFHTHAEGEGMELNLVKTQVRWGCVLNCSANPMWEHLFVVHLPVPAEIVGQVVFASYFVPIFYNARTNAAGIVWQSQVTSEQYRQLLKESLEMVELYHTPFWISDIRKQGRVGREIKNRC